MKIKFNFKRLTVFIFLACLLFLPVNNIIQAKQPIKDIYILTTPTCPHCNTAKNWLADFKQENELDLTIVDYNLATNLQAANNFYHQYNVPNNSQGIVPAIFVGDKYFIGFSDQIGQTIADYILDRQVETNGLTEIPFLGSIDLLEYSLPALAVILGIVDGFNVCSLGALVIILGLVMVLRSRKKIFLIGGAFLITTALVYGLLIFLWHQFFTILSPYIRSLELLIGILALAGGIYLLWEFYKACKSGPVCASNNLISRLTPKIERIFKHKTNWLVLMGAVALFAVAVTIIEFPCSAFLPVLFTSILVEAGIPLSTSIFYISLYMLFYLLNELIIFIIAILTLRVKIVSPRFIIIFNLLAALIFLFLGVYYLAGWLA